MTAVKPSWSLVRPCPWAPNWRALSISTEDPPTQDVWSLAGFSLVGLPEPSLPHHPPTQVLTPVHPVAPARNLGLQPPLVMSHCCPDSDAAPVRSPHRLSSGPYLSVSLNQSPSLQDYHCLVQWLSRQDHQSSRSHWKLDRSADSRALPQTYRIRNSAGGPVNLCLKEPSRRFC